MHIGYLSQSSWQTYMLSGMECILCFCLCFAAGIPSFAEQQCKGQVSLYKIADLCHFDLTFFTEHLSSKCRQKPAVIANMSARVGSIGDNSLGGWYSYRASKSALNQLTKTMSLECARRKLNVACILLHPGTVDTDLSLPFQKVCAVPES